MCDAATPEKGKMQMNLTLTNRQKQMQQFQLFQVKQQFFTLRYKF
jgi:hypothetical protein